MDRRKDLTPIQRQIEAVVTNGTGYSDRFWRNRFNWNVSSTRGPEVADPLFEICASWSSIGLLDLRSGNLKVESLRGLIALERIRVDLSFDPDYLDYYNRPLDDNRFPTARFIRDVLVA